MVIKRTSPASTQDHGLIAVLDPACSPQEVVDRFDEAAISRDRVAFMMMGKELESSERLGSDGAAEGGGMIAGGVVGALVGLSTLAIPGFGILLLAGGPMLAGAMALAGGMGGVGLGAIMGAVLEEEVVKGHSETYEKHLAAGRAILMFDGTDAELAIAQNILKSFPTISIDVFAPSPAIEPVPGMPAV